MKIKVDIKENSGWQYIQHNWIIQLSNKSVIILTGASLLIIILRWPHMPPLVPLWYSLPWGNEQLALPYWLIVLPLGSALIFGINAALSVYLFAEYLIFVQLAFLTSLLVSLLSFITLIKILSLVT